VSIDTIKLHLSGCNKNTLKLNCILIKISKSLVTVPLIIVNKWEPRFILHTINSRLNLQNPAKLKPHLFMAHSGLFTCVYVWEHIYVYFYKFINVYLHRSMLKHPIKTV